MQNATNKTNKIKDTEKVELYHLTLTMGDRFNQCTLSTNKNLWDIVKDANNNFIGGLNDWFVPSNNELQKINDSGVISIKEFIWSSFAYLSRYYQARCLNYSILEMIYHYRSYDFSGIICRYF